MANKAQKEFFDLIERVFSIREIPVDQNDLPIEMVVTIVPQGNANAFRTGGAKVSYSWIVNNPLEAVFTHPTLQGDYVEISDEDLEAIRKKSIHFIRKMLKDYDKASTNRKAIEILDKTGISRPKESSNNGKG